MTSAPSAEVRTPASLDPGVARFIESLGGSLVPPVETLPWGRMRATVNAALLGHDRVGFVPETVFATTDSSFAGVPARTYFPSVAPRAVIVYLHGGGFVAGNPDTHDKITRRLANGVSAIVIAADYRLAPEHPFPAAFEDTVAVVREAADRYPFLPLIVMGDSAGGALAASVAQWATETRAVRIDAQILVYPCIDIAPDRDSMRRLGEGYLLTAADLAFYRSSYLASTPATSRYALPGNATDLDGLPRAIVAIAGFDPLHDEGDDYACRLADAAVDVQLLEHGGLIHGWLEIVDLVPAAAAARDELVGAIAALADSLPVPLSTPTSPTTTRATPETITKEHTHV